MAHRMSDLPKVPEPQTRRLDPHSLPPIVAHYKPYPDITFPPPKNNYRTAWDNIINNHSIKENTQTYPPSVATPVVEHKNGKEEVESSKTLLKPDLNLSTKDSQHLPIFSYIDSKLIISFEPSNPECTSISLEEEDTSFKGVTLHLTKKHTIQQFSFSERNILIENPAIRYLVDKKMLYLRLRKRKQEVSLEVGALNEEVIFDFDSKDRLFGIAILNPSKYVNKELLQTLNSNWFFMSVADDILFRYSKAGLNMLPAPPVSENGTTEITSQVEDGEEVDQDQLSTPDEDPNGIDDSSEEVLNIKRKKNTPKNRGTQFFWKYTPNAVVVQLYGEFSSWSIGHRLKRRPGGCWGKCFAFYPGVWAYRYKIDGVWMHDPEQPTVPDPDGVHTNNVIIIQDSSWRHNSFPHEATEVKTKRTARCRRMRRSHFLHNICNGYLDLAYSEYTFHPGVINDKDSQGANFVLLAASYGHVPILRWAKSLGAPLDVQRIDGSTPFMQAALHGHLNVIDWFCQKEDHQEHLLKNLHIIENYLKYGKKTLAKEEKDEREKDFENGGHLIGFIKDDYYNAQISKYLSVYDGQGENALFSAAAGGQLAVVQWFIDCGAVVELSSKTGCTPFHRAVMSGHAEVAKLLVANGANINAQNAKGRTAFHMAINNGDVKLLGWLLENGLIPDLTESVGLSIIDHLKGDSDLDNWFKIHRTSEK